MNDGYIIVTGATRGIGAAIATELAAGGARVAGLTRSGETAAGEGFVCDVADEAGIAKAVAEVAARGPIAGLVNNAGVYEEHESDQHRRRRLRARHAHQRDLGGGGLARGLPAPEAGGRRADRQHRLVLRQDGRDAQRRLLRLEGGDRRDHALPGRRVGGRQHPRGRRGARLHRHRPQCRVPREGQRQGLDQAAHPGRPARRTRGGRAAGRLRCSAPTSAS